MDRHIIPGSTVYRFFVDKLGNKQSQTFIGDEGEIFYDPVYGDLRISDDVTPGGIPLLIALNNATANGIYSGGNGANTSGGGGGGGGSGNTTPVDPSIVWNYTIYEAQGIVNYGNVKQGFQLADHFGWVLLNGRPITALTATQQAIATRLGWTTVLPNATGKITKMKGAPGSVGGSDTTVINQFNLPNVNLTGTTDGIAHEDHAGATLGYSGKWLFNSGGNFTRNVSVALNPGAQSALGVENAYMSLNTFVYLGA